MEKVCELCGEVFFTSSKIKKYCSDDCRYEAQWVDHPKHTCDYCGDTFRRAESKIVTEKKYCSRACLNEVRKELLKRRKGIRYQKAEIITFTCKHCGKVSEQKCYKQTKRKEFCNVSCASKYRHLEKERLGAKNLKELKKLKGVNNEKNNNL